VRCPEKGKVFQKIFDVLILIGDRDAEMKPLITANGDVGDSKDQELKVFSYRILFSNSVSVITPYRWTKCVHCPCNGKIFEKFLVLNFYF
jgi:hypothetical protein